MHRHCYEGIAVDRAESLKLVWMLQLRDDERMAELRRCLARLSRTTAGAGLGTLELDAYDVYDAEHHHRVVSSRPAELIAKIHQLAVSVVRRRGGWHLLSVLRLARQEIRKFCGRFRCVVDLLQFGRQGRDQVVHRGTDWTDQADD